MIARLFVALAIVVGGGGRAWALDPDRAPEELQHRAWQTRDGLPTNYVRALLQTRDGFLRIATRSGLVRFDGSEFTPAGPPGAPSMVTDAALHETADGVLWAASNREGLYRREGGRWVIGLTQDRLAHHWVRGITSAPDGTIWIGTPNGATAIRAGSVTHLLQGQRDVDNIRAIGADSAGRLWLGTPRGLVSRLGEKLTTFDPPGADFGDVRALLVERDGGVWAGGAGALVHRGPAGAWDVHPVPGKVVTSVLRDRDGQIWIGLNSGEVGNLKAGRFRLITLPGLLSPGSVLAMAEDGEGNLWIGTQRGGLHCLSDGPRFVNRWTGSDAPGVRAIEQAPDGSVWLAARDGRLTRFHDGVFEDVAYAWPLVSSPALFALTIGREGQVWLSFGDGVIGRPEGGRLVTLPTPEGESGKERPVLLDREGRLWMGGRRLHSFADGRTTWHEDVSDVRVLHEGPGGTLWIGTVRGLFRQAGDRIEPVVPRAGPAPKEALSLREDGDGVLWIGARSTNGFFRVQGDRSTVFGEAQGLPVDEVYQILDDDADRLWLTAAGRVLWIDKRDLASVAAGRKRRVDPVVHDRDALRSFLALAHGQPAGTRTRDGRLWFPSDGGAVVFDGRRPDVPPPPVYVHELRVEGRAIPLEGEARLPPTPGYVEVHFGALSLSAPEKTIYRYRMDGLDTDWVSSGRDRVARYQRVPPGRYRFRVQARNGHGVWSRQDANVAFVIAPPLPRRPVFLAAAALALALAVAGAHRLRVRRLHARHEAVLAERARIAREMHDTLAQSFAAVSTEIECLHDELRSGGGGPKVTCNARALARDGLVGARRAIWALRPAALEAGDLPAALREICRQHGRDVPVDFVVDGRPRLLDEDVEQNLLRVGQEAIVNALRHARPSRIEVCLRYGRAAAA